MSRSPERLTILIIGLALVMGFVPAAWADPGDDAVAEQAAAWCEMDNDQTAAGYRPVVWTPSAQSWSQGDRAALCIAWLDD